MLLTWTDFAWEQYEELQEKDKRLIKKINKNIEVINLVSFQPPGYLRPRV